MDDLKYWLWLDIVFGNNGRVWEIMNFFENAGEAYYELNFNPKAIELSPKEIQNMREYKLNIVENLINECNKIGVGIISYSSEKYPKQLKYILNPPAVIYYRGNIDCLSSKKIVTSVGTRRASDYSLYVTRNICHELATNDIIIASGFARGIDTASHLESVNAKKPTICVMGCGVDVNYPVENFQYRDMILETGGVFISEFSIGTQAFGSNFPKRNRILSAISQASIVFQASMSSGSLITAQYAAEQGREVFCMPPPDIFNPAYSGNINLLRNGALPFYGSEDILSYFDMNFYLYPEKEIHNKAVNNIPKNNNNIYKEPKEESENITTNINNSESSEDDAEYLKICNKILEILSESPLHVDVIAQKINVNTTELLTALTELEIMGDIRSLPGKMFEIKR